jgi:SpoVK/Ycf46/Vps4 family AAA+-type ATPase
MDYRQATALIYAHYRDDEVTFEATVAAMIANETAKGHYTVAGDLRRAADARRTNLARMVRVLEPKAPAYVRVSAPAATFSDLVLHDATLVEVVGLLHEHERRADLAAAGLWPTARLLMHGAPGNGKTKCAEALATALALPFYYVTIDGLVSSFMGETCRNLRTVFDFAAANPGLLFLDEFDAIAKTRSSDGGGGAAGGEERRTVNALLQIMDAAPRELVVVAATNTPSLIDRAVWRRFDLAVGFAAPDVGMARRLVAKLLGDYPLVLSEGADPVAEAAAILSMSGIERAVRLAKKEAVLSGSRAVTAASLLACVRRCSERQEEAPT